MSSGRPDRTAAGVEGSFSQVPGTALVPISAIVHLIDTATLNSNSTEHLGGGQYSEQTAAGKQCHSMPSAHVQECTDPQTARRTHPSAIVHQSITGDGFSQGSAHQPSFKANAGGFLGDSQGNIRVDQDQAEGAGVSCGTGVRGQHHEDGHLPC